MSVRQTVVVTALLHLMIATVVSYKFGWHLSGLVRMNAGSAEARAHAMSPGMVVLTNSTGFDGKENYFVAVDPFPGRDYEVPYRLKRILYPLTAHLLALGDRRYLPIAMFAVNLIAIAAGAWFLARALAFAGQPPAFALVYSASIGEIIGVKYSLTTPLSTALAAAGLYFWLRKRTVPASICFALSLLANEYTLVIPLALAAHSLFRREWARAAILAVSPAPWAAYLLYIVTRYSGRAVTDAAEVFAGPFQGLLDIVRHLDSSVPWPRFCYSDLSPLLFFGLVMLIASLQIVKLRSAFLPYTLLIVYYIVFSIFLKEDCWRIINISRYLSPIFPLLVAGAIEQPHKWDRPLAAATLVFSALSLAGIILEPRVPFVIWPN